MDIDSTHVLAQLDQRHFWHPFTQMKDWCAPDHEPLIISEGRGPYLIDSRGRSYLDGNSSIWTNIHGHCHPRIVEAIQSQAARLCHASTLGLTNEPAVQFAAKLCSQFPPGTLEKVFFTSDGSTAIECALKMALQFPQLTGKADRTHFVSFDQAYHGDTAGAAALGAIHRFQGGVEPGGFPTFHVDSFEALVELAPAQREQITAVVLEPLIQGAAGMRVWPKGMLSKLRAWCDQHDILLILDEIMTGFGRTGTMFACEQENVIPDFLVLGKGISGGALPLAAVITTTNVFNAFLGDVEQLKTFYYGHSYTGNPLACAAALASLRLFEEEQTLENLEEKVNYMRRRLEDWNRRSKRVLRTRQCGFIAAIDIGRDAEKSFSYEWYDQVGLKICIEARRHGLLTRPILDTLVLMPPLCITIDQLEQAFDALEVATETVTAQQM